LESFPCITYTADKICIFNRFQNEIWDMAVEEAESLGCKNVADMIAGFRRADMVENIGTFKNLMVWFACEKLAWEMARDLSGRAPPGIRGGKARKPRGRTV